jgi:hypothetical protein
MKGADLGRLKNKGRGEERTMLNRTIEAERGPPAAGRILWCALVPLFALAEAARRAVEGSRRDEATAGRHDEASAGRRGWLTEAKTQASIATSYALMARALLH